MDSALLLLVLAAVSWLLVYAVRLWTHRRRILDIPNQRSSHSQPMPRGGGIAIVAVTLATGAWYARVDAAPSMGWSLAAYLLAGLLIATIGWLDDLRSVGSLVRLACHCGGAALVLVTLDLAALLPGPAAHWWLAEPLLLVWIVGLTNIYNFMDGIDGLAASQAVVAAAWWVAVGLWLRAPWLTALALALAGGSLGFLAHNWAPARIFMGDVSSTFLGYTFAVLPLLAMRAGGDWTLLIGGALTVWPFLFDGVLTIVRRAARGENLFQAHRSHLYQRLVIHGWSHRTVTTLYTFYALVAALCAFAIVVGRWSWAIAAIPIGLGLLLFFWVWRVERRPVDGGLASDAGRRPPS